jgi:hypothetical protein
MCFPAPATIERCRRRRIPNAQRKTNEPRCAAAPESLGRRSFLAADVRISKQALRQGRHLEQVDLHGSAAR